MASRSAARPCPETARQPASLPFVRFRVAAPLLLFFAVVVSASAEPAATREGIAIRPGATDTEIKTFNTPHFIYVDRDIVVDRQANLPPTGSVAKRRGQTGPEAANKILRASD